MGDVIEGKYQMSLNSWEWNIDRNAFLDFVPVTKDNYLLMMIPKNPEVDPGLFIRPFKNEVWQWIGNTEYRSANCQFANCLLKRQLANECSTTNFTHKTDKTYVYCICCKL